MKPYKKIKYTDFKEKEFRAQPYMFQLNLAQARLRFKIKSFMTPTVKLNFASDPTFASQNFKCWEEECQSID